MVGFCPYCMGQTGTGGFLHNLYCPYNPLSSVKWTEPGESNVEWYDKNVSTPRVLELEQKVGILERQVNYYKAKTERQKEQITRLETSRKSLRELIKSLRGNQTEEQYV